MIVSTDQTHVLNLLFQAFTSFVARQLHCNVRSFLHLISIVMDPTICAFADHFEIFPLLVELFVGYRISQGALGSRWRCSARLKFHSLREMERILVLLDGRMILALNEVFIAHHTTKSS